MCMSPASQTDYVFAIPINSPAIGRRVRQKATNQFEASCGLSPEDGRILLREKQVFIIEDHRFCRERESHDFEREDWLGVEEERDEEKCERSRWGNPHVNLLFQMASANKALASAAALLLLLSLASSTKVNCPPVWPPPQPKPHPKPQPQPSCPRDTLKLGACANLLNGLININIGKPPKTPCCKLIEGLADVEAAACLCTVITGDILGINLNVPVSLSLLLNYCGKKVPPGFKCA